MTPEEPPTRDSTPSGYQTSPSSVHPEIVFFETVHDFGSVPAGQKVSYTFPFANAGNAPLRVMHVRASCGCTATNLAKKVLEPNEFSQLQVNLSVGNNPGLRTRKITVMSNDPNSPRTLLTVTADVQAPPLRLPTTMSPWKKQALKKRPSSSTKDAAVRKCIAPA